MYESECAMVMVDNSWVCSMLSCMCVLNHQSHTMNKYLNDTQKKIHVQPVAVDTEFVFKFIHKIA